eukprot:359667-Chlamydomonas_euryale.AAC.1
MKPVSSRKLSKLNKRQEQKNKATQKHQNRKGHTCVISTKPSSPTGVGARSPPMILGATNAMTYGEGHVDWEGVGQENMRVGEWSTRGRGHDIAP